MTRGGGSPPPHGPIVSRDAATTRATAPSSMHGAILGYRAEIARSDALIARYALDDPPLVTPDELPGEITTVRDVVLHVIEEVARHVGHLDIARELLDGATGLGPR
ncbi:MAG TPA: DUF664 domain-containing protein [Pseudonocardia sp.]|uniref:mycothiol transferase n=1 Tax=Pseudonocardia sp. TaxID=60912 RepID=UPI002B4B61F8|nr:DUF664 domain-containing protein [Pseudonocardia sp.]HLU56127.1 DUF664 domain-containing protein [Pseudonocardia sp.]